MPDPPALRLTIEGVTDTTGPEGETVAVKFKVPEKSLTLARLITELSLDPTGIVRMLGLAVIVKSAPAIAVTVSVKVAEDALAPAGVPVILMVHVPGVAVG
jgi:hypothetical protein